MAIQFTLRILYVLPKKEITGQIVSTEIEVRRTLGGPGLLESVYLLRIDLVVAGPTIVKSKVVEKHNTLLKAQTLTDLRLTELKLALIINFNTRLVKDGIGRIANKL